jgi:hypothetical protein
MLYEFVTTYRDAIIAKTRIKVGTRPWPPASSAELEHGLPIFLTQLAETLRWEHTDTPFSNHAIGESAAHHGAIARVGLHRFPGRPRLRGHLPGHHGAGR